ncbi:hypothetical protein D9M70_623360 [compost metagenome]
MPASGNVAAAEITDHRDAGQLGQQGRITDLHREAACGFMANGLAVTANRANVVRLEVLLGKEGVNTLRCQFHPVLLGNGGAGDLVRTAGAQAKQLGAQ